MIHSDLTKENIERLNRFVVQHGGVFHSIFINAETFGSAYTSFHITKEAYYRLLAQDLLPNELDRVLYLDGDLVVQKNFERALQYVIFRGETEKKNTL